MKEIKEEIKDIIREQFYKKDWQRLWFTVSEVGHAAKNIPREWLRSLGFPEANWVDIIAGVITLIPVFLLGVMVFNCPEVNL